MRLDSSVQQSNKGSYHRLPLELKASPLLLVVHLDSHRRGHRHPAQLRKAGREDKGRRRVDAIGETKLTARQRYSKEEKALAGTGVSSSAWKSSELLWK
jgi:hypothetical protein